MKKLFDKIKKHKKALVTLTLALMVSVALYTNFFGLSSTKTVTDYLYNADYSDSGSKILGEAKLVDSIDGLIENANSDSTYGESYFSNASVNREKSRDEALQTLQVVVESSETLPEVRSEALGEIMQIANDIEIEATVEEMIKAKGFEDCVAIISGEKINVIVKSEGLMTSEVAQITDIVKNETGFEAENIRIVEKA